MQVFVRFNTDGEIVVSMEAQHDEDGQAIMPEGYEGLFEVPEEFFEEQYLYRKKDGGLVKDGELVVNHRARVDEIDRENRRALRMQKASERLQEIEAIAVVQTATVADDVIALAPLLPEWSPKPYAVGDVVQYDDAPYKCVQAHDATGNSGWNPIAAASLWAKYHATSVEYALPFAQPTGSHDAYQKDEYMVYMETVYRCKTNNTVHGPDALPSAWEAV